MNDQMEFASLIGRKVRLVLTEPWDAVTEAGPGPFIGRIDAINSGGEPTVLLTLDPGVIVKAKLRVIFLASARHHSTTVQDIASGSEVVCNLIDVSGAQSLTPEELCNSNRTRDGLHMIGDIRILPNMGTC
jgi:hypothetical protein